ncbi:MAG TPA: ATP-binding cassette domain-containing protein [Candidatus Methylacidiphilales bacterium]
MPPAAVIEEVTKTFRGASSPALDGVTASIGEGIVTGIVGPDGAGKTTLMRLLAGLMRPDSGRIRIGALDPVRDRAEARKAVGYMPQKFGLYEDLTVAENLALHADLREVPASSRAALFGRLLAFTALGPFAAWRAGGLSGGMKQKLGLACALLGEPRLLLLDEPSVGVDPVSRRELWTMVGGLAREGMAVAWSTAYLDEAERCARVLLLQEGRLLHLGPPSDFTARVAGRCFRLRRAEGRHRALLGRCLRRPEVLDGVIQGESLRVVLRKGASPPRLEELGAGGAAVWEPAEPGLEDAFIDILGGGPGGDSPLAARLRPIPRDGAAVVEATGLTKKFGRFVAADGITFRVRRGEIFGLLGPNGAGKSTTFKMLCGLLPPTSGTARVMGFDIGASAGAARQRLGYMAQKFSLYGNLTVAQNLRFFSGAYGLEGDARSRAIDGMAEVFRLGPHLASRADELPLGHKQRLALACAMMHGPDLLFLDEPTSGVDPVSRREFWSHINGLVEKGVTAIVTTHFMEEAEYCDRIGLILHGRLLALGTPDELKRLASTPAEPEPTMEEAFVRLVSREGP